MKTTLRAARLVLVAFLISGASALIYEVTWTRALSLVLGSTVYALSTMLSTFMAGLALGGFLGGRLADRTKSTLYWFGVCELGIGATGLASVALIEWGMPALYLQLYQTLHLYPALFFILQIGLCVAVMLVPTMLMGATFPLVTRYVIDRLHEIGRSVGNAYSFNTVGAVIGSLSVGFLLIPKLGIKGATAVAASMNLMVGAGAVIAARRRVVVTLGAAVAGLVASGSWLWMVESEIGLVSIYTLRRTGNASFAQTVRLGKEAYREIYRRELAEGPVRAYRDREGALLLRVGARLEGTTGIDMVNTLLLAYLPLASHANARSFLTIGLGAGVTLNAAKHHVDRTSLVEINPGVVEVVRQHGAPGVLDGVEIFLEDARNLLLRTDRKWDVISSEPSYPAEAEVANLFTREFFELASTRLSEGGVYCQWLPYYVLTNDDVTMMLKTFGSAFPHVYLWKIEESLDLLLVGSRSPFVFSSDEIRARVEALNADAYELKYTLSRRPEQISEIIGRSDVPMHTDDRPILEFRVADNFLEGNLAEREHEELQRHRPSD